MEIEVFRASWGIGSYDPLEGFTRIRGMSKAKILGNLGMRYAHWLEGVMTAPPGTEVKTWNESNM